MKKTILVKLVICRNNKESTEINARIIMDEKWDEDKVRKCIRETAELNIDDQFRIFDLTEKCVVTPDYFLELDPNNKNHQFRIDVKDHSKC